VQASQLRAQPPPWRPPPHMPFQWESGPYPRPAPVCVCACVFVCVCACVCV
jgi:hypothetical protein